MKSITKAVVIASSLLFSLSASALSGKTDAEYLTQCKSSIVEKLGEVDRLKTLGIKSRRNMFEAKFRINNNDDRFVMSCEVGKDQVVSLNCVDGDACAASSFAVLQIQDK
jgi:hypothetical protein